jgi:hypothetical protein
MGLGVLANQLVRADQLLRKKVAMPDLPSSEPTTPLKDVGTFALNLAIVTFGTPVSAAPVLSAWSRLSRAHSVYGIEARQWFLSFTIAALMGFFIGRRWTKTAIWVWILPVIIFVSRAVEYSTGETPGVLVSSGLVQHFLAPNCVADRPGCRDFYGSTLPVVETLGYSLGAWLWSHFQRSTH